MYSSPLTSTSITFEGTMPWPSPLELTPYFSYDNSTYAAGAPFTVALSPSPPPTTTTTFEFEFDNKAHYLVDSRQDTGLLR